MEMIETRSHVSFGEQLKTYRKQQGLTQQQVARKLALHHNTIGAWERGDYLPATRGMILELARCLHLDKEETHDMLEASLTTVAFRWSVPYQRNPFFTGRHAVLQQLHTLLSGESSVTAPRSCALSGLGGMGKTQTALEYAYRHILDYAAIFWVQAETEEGLLGSFASIARTLKLPVQYTQKQEDVVELVLDWFTTHRNWLLIFDNVEQRELVTRFVPSSPHGSFLLTTRLPTLGTLAPCLELQPLPLEESIQLIFRRTGAQPLSPSSEQISAEEEKAARAIATAMDGLPLALDQAAAYIEESQCRFVGFLSLLQRDALRILQEHPSSATYPRSVEKTFTLAFERLQQQNRIAADLLTLCCFLASDNIPEALLIKETSHFPEELQAVLSDPFRLETTFKDLLTYALLHRNTQAKTLSVHSLVQTVLKEQMPEAVQRMWTQRLIRLLDHLFLIKQDQLDIEHWSWCEQVLPHAYSVLQVAERLHLMCRELGSLLQKIATYLFQRERYEQAEAFYLHALSMQKRLLGEDHLEVALTLAGLAKTYDSRENYQEIEPLYQHAISLLEASLGLEHLQLAFPLQGLAMFCIRMSRYQEAEALLQRALSICTQHLGPDHPDVATAQHNLAIGYYNQGKYAQAEPLYLQALHLRQRALHPHHPAIGIVLNDLALLYRQQARYQEAEQFHLSSLAIYEQTLGPEHTEVAIALNNLASIYWEQAKYELAEPLYQRALAISKRVFGPNDSFGACFLNNLAKLYCYQGRYEEAEAAATRALSIYEQHLASDHHTISNPLQSLAQLAYQQSRYDQAEAFSSRALAIRERTLPDHPKLAVTLHLKANLCRVRGRYKEAESLYQRALDLYQKHLAPEHPDIAHLEDDFAMLLLSQNRWKEAKQRYQESLRIWGRYQELDHPSHADCLEHYAELLERQQRGQEANAYRQQAREMRAKRRVISQATLQNLQEPMKATDGAKAFQADESTAMDHFETFLLECCVLSAHTSCQTADLWRAYQRWALTQENDRPLSRQTFTFRLKEKGCLPTRTNTHRIWEGIELK